MGFETNNIDQGQLLLLQKRLKTLQAEVDAIGGGGGGLSFDDIYPVGSIYMSVNNADPGTLFGGTWQQIEDTFLLAAGTNHAAGSTGGEETHTLTESEMPEHTHALYYYNANGDKSFGYNYQNKGTQSQQTTASGGIVNAGGGQAHNNMPPYLAVYVWKRTA